MRGLSAMRPLYCAAHEHFAHTDFPIAFHVPTDSMQFLADALANFRVQIQLVAIIFAVAMLIEALRPAQPRQPWRNVAFNLGYTAFVVLVNALLLPPLLQFLQPLVQRHGLQIPIHFPDGLGWQALQALVFLFIHDFFYYWFHRAQHRFPFAWPLHKLHHADESVNVTTSLRHHWLEEPFRVWLILVPIGLIFDQKPVTISWIATVLGLFGFFVHMNVRLPLGSGTWIFAGPQWHRLHHSIEPQHTDRNFAAFFPIFDIAFGTYCKPGNDEYPATGLHSRENLNSPWRAVVSPFTDWARMLGKQAITQQQPEPVEQPPDQDGNAAANQDAG